MIDRRALVAAGLTLAACDRSPALSQPAPQSVPSLRTAASFPIGCAVTAEGLKDPALTRLVPMNCDQITPEWQMKMEYIVQPDGTFRFEAPDLIADFARGYGLRLFGHTLVWYAQAPEAFERLNEQRRSFADAYRNYILAVVGRYRGKAVGWDVVNEPIAEDGNGWRESLWASRLGAFDHIKLAFEHAREADPDAVLFLNDYNLESLPRKRVEFLRLAERLLAAGAPLTGIGTQTHIDADLQPGALRAALTDLAGLGLPVHVSEIDVSLARARGLSRREAETRQAALYAEAVEAFGALPERQRFAFTLWGLRDKDSWLKREAGWDTPALFDDNGEPKAAAAAFVAALS